MAISTCAGFLLLVGAVLPHQTPGAASAPVPDPTGTYLGILFAPSATLNRSTAPAPPVGITITQVIPKSPADVAGLRRHDQILSYDGDKLTTCEQLAKRIQGDTPGRVVKLLVHREGKPVTLEARLTVGPPLRLMGESRASGGETPATSKPAGPMLSAQVEPLPDGRLRVELRYYLEGSGRLRSHTLTGTIGDLQREIDKLAESERRLAQVLLDRLKKLDLTPAAPRP